MLEKARLVNTVYDKVNLSVGNSALILIFHVVIDIV